MTAKIKDKVIYDQLTLDVVKTLERRHGVCDIKVAEKQGVDKGAITAWEQKFSCMMPDDMKSFYFTSNGLLLTWSVKLNSEGRIPVGRMELNPLERLTRLSGPPSGEKDTFPSLADVEAEDEDDANGDSPIPRFDHRSRIFTLDPCDGYGKVCYVFRNTKPGIPAQKAEVWFMDRALQWHFLAANFMDYFRLMLSHLGLPQWYYAFTDIGLPTQAKQWFNVYGPVRLAQDTHIYDDSPQSHSNDVPTNTLDVARVLKGKGDKKKAAANQAAKKKQLIPSAKSTGRTPMPGTNQHQPYKR